MKECIIWSMIENITAFVRPFVNDCGLEVTEILQRKPPKKSFIGKDWKSSKASVYIFPLHLGHRTAIEEYTEHLKYLARKTKDLLIMCFIYRRPEDFNDACCMCDKEILSLVHKLIDSEPELQPLKKKLLIISMYSGLTDYQKGILKERIQEVVDA